MFRRWPFFQRLLSWTKPYAPERATAARVPALRLEQPDRLRARAPVAPGRASWTAPRTSRRGPRWRRASRPSPTAPASRSATTAAGSARGATTARTARCSRSRRPTASTAAGSSCSRSASPSRGARARRASSTPATTRETRDGDDLCGQAAVHHRQAELRVRARVGPGRLGVEDHGLRRRRPPRPSVQTKSLVGVRARYVQPFEDNFLGLGVSILDASIDWIEPIGDAFRVNLKRTDNGEPMSVEADEVIAATGFTCPLQDLTDLGVTTFGQAKLPAVTPMWESRDGARDLLRGHDQLGGAGPQEARHPVLLGGRAGPSLQRPDPRPAHRGDAVRRRDGAAVGRRRRTCVPYLLREATCAPELWHQKAYLARVLIGVAGRRDPRRGHPARRARARRR